MSIGKGTSSPVKEKRKKLGVHTLGEFLRDRN